jgi:type IX secretion system PorP/SprF family membrane protein
VHFTQFTSSPLVLNPAFTGAFNGTVRASVIYRDQWRSVTANNFRTIAASIDAPIVHDLSIDDYLAAGLQVYNDKAGDGNLQNFSALASLAYHKFFGRETNSSLSVGFQGGFTQKSLDLSQLYFGNQYNNGGWINPVGTEFEGPINYFTINAGLGWSQKVGERFSYSLGVGANNLNQPSETFRTRNYSEVGLGMRYTGQLGAIIYTSDRFSIRPGVLFQSQSTAQEIVAGAELHFLLGNPEFESVASAIYGGIYTRLNDAILANIGVEFKGFRIGVSYDYNTSDLKSASNGNGGFEVSIRYIAPNPFDFARRLIYPCSRF